MKKIVFFTALAVYVLACVLPAYKLDNGTSYDGATCLLVGIFAILYNEMAFVAWLANFTFILGVVSYFAKWKGIIWRVLQAAGVAMSFGAFSVHKFLLNEAGHEAKATIAYGAFVWIASLILMLVASLLKDKQEAA